MALSFLGVVAATLITTWATICVVATFATDEYRPILVPATGWPLLSLLLLFAAWSRLGRGGRIGAIVLAVADVAILFEAIARWAGAR